MIVNFVECDGIGVFREEDFAEVAQAEQQQRRAEIAVRAPGYNSLPGRCAAPSGLQSQVKHWLTGPKSSRDVPR